MLGSCATLFQKRASSLGGRGQVSMVAQSPPIPAQSPVVPQDVILPSLFAEGYGAYRTSPAAFVFSYVANLLIATLLIWSGLCFVRYRREIYQQVLSSEELTY